MSNEQMPQAHRLAELDTKHKSTNPIYDLSNITETEELTQKLRKMTESQQAITFIDLSGSTAAAFCIPQIVTAVSKIKTITSINLSSCGIKKEEALTLMTELRNSHSNHKVKQLDLSHNKIIGFHFLTTFLEKACGFLINIDLSHNGIMVEYEESSVAPLHGIMRFGSIKNLILDNNNISSFIAEKIKTGFQADSRKTYGILSIKHQGQELDLKFDDINFKHDTYLDREIGDEAIPVITGNITSGMEDLD
ncbi:MAG: hypothetical protein RLZZ59_2 [Pseudomonadota bacterium]|jgi:Ran GTPase-activating protein (RanGAP) involved in mRNA processing and transport